MKPRRIASVGFGLAFVGSMFGASSLAQADQMPDIIVVMVDDLGYIDDDRILERLPHIRQTFLDGGLRFERMYGETPLCCPGRAGFLTGQHTLRHGVLVNDGDLLDPRFTIAVALQRSGYHTMMVGKYLNRYAGTRQPRGWDQISMFSRHGETLVSLATQWLDESPPDKPIFAWFSSSAPHKKKNTGHPYRDDQYIGAGECQGIPPFKPPSYRTWGSPRPFPRHMPDWPDGWQLVEVCESLLVVDELVGEITKAQEARGRPSYYLFVSDNGMAWGQKGFPGKHVPPATQIPFYVAGPDVIGGTSTTALLSNIDIAPTLAEVANADIPWADGASFRGLIAGQELRGRRRILEIYPAGPSPWAAIRLTDWRYVRWGDGRRELYHLVRDPWEMRNLVDRRPRKAAEMERRLDRLIQAAR